MKRFENLLGSVMGPVRVDRESPFMATFVAKIQNDEIVAMLTGVLGRAIYKTLRIHDLFRVDGYTMSGSRCGLDYKMVFGIEHITLPKDAKKGRNLNMWG